MLASAWADGPHTRIWLAALLGRYPYPYDLCVLRIETSCPGQWGSPVWLRLTGMDLRIRAQVVEGAGRDGHNRRFAVAQFGELLVT
jgi:hypothetical protein